MSRQDYVFTSESVSEGHPDKVCDRISDAVLDAFLKEEPNARVPCETFATTNRVVVGGEVGLSSKEATHAMMQRVDGIVRDCVRDIGYEQKKFHWDKIKVHNYIHEQSAHIAQGVDRDGAGDQGIMFGYATLETAEYMPAPIQYAHAILRRLAGTLETPEAASDHQLLMLLALSYVEPQHRLGLLDDGLKVYEELAHHPDFDDDGRAAAQVVLEAVGNIDLAPTICALAGCTMPNADGRSLVPLIKGQRTKIGRRFIFTEMLHAGVFYGHRPTGRPAWAGVESTRGYSDTLWAYARYSTGEEELYNVSRDPHHLRNLAARPAFRSVLTDMRSFCRSVWQGDDVAWRHKLKPR